ncbi:MAG: FHA domain-containing protein [Caldilineales bacterium]|nr:FHA domain-containing protein [Caldilineales bacterium]
MTWFLIDPTGYRYPIGPSGLSLGRAPDNDVVLNEDEVSRHHAFIQISEQNAWLYDRKSFNGVFVNDVRIAAPQTLQTGDRIRIGRTRFRVEHSAEPPAAPKPAEAKSLTSGQIWRAILIGVVLGLAGLALVVLLFVRPLMDDAQNAGATPNPYAAFQPAVAASAFILSQIGDTSTASGGAGVVVGENGRVLTAYRVVYDPLTGQPYNRKSQAIVGLGGGSGQSPDQWYLARVVRADRQRDLAVLQIFAQDDGSPLPNSFRLQPAPLASAAALRAGERLAAISYPVDSGSGAPSDIGRVLTVSEGAYTGSLPDDNLGVSPGWLQSEVNLSAANVGALVLNARGQVVGLYTGPPSAGSGRADNLIRPMEVARTLLVGAQ